MVQNNLAYDMSSLQKSGLVLEKDWSLPTLYESTLAAVGRWMGDLVARVSR